MINIATLPSTSLAVAAAGGDRIDLGKRLRSEKNETCLVIRALQRLTAVCLKTEQYN